MYQSYLSSRPFGICLHYLNNGHYHHLRLNLLVFGLLVLPVGNLLELHHHLLDLLELMTLLVPILDC